jgi:type I restriction enzyme M protein
MDSNLSVPKKIRAIREALSLSQEELASKLGVSFATVNRWEGGKSEPQRAQAEKLEELITAVQENHDLAPTINGNADKSAKGTKKRRGLSPNGVLATKSMEQMLWDAACSIRGEKDAPKFKDYLLPLLFIKRLSDVFDDEVQRLIETYGDRETALEVLEADHTLVRFYIPPEARWAVVSGREAFNWSAEKKPKSLGEQLTTTIRLIVKSNPTLAGVIDIVDYNETRNGEREISDQALKAVIETYSDPRYRLGLQDVEPDFLGRCYEYLLRKFAEGQGQSAGEFFTPTEVGFLMAELMRPRPGEECYDYACGSFGLLIKLQLVCKRINPLAKVPLQLFGQELTGSSFAIACMNKIIHDMEGEILRGDSMRNPKFKQSDTSLRKFDIVVANPMWNQPFDSDVFKDDPFERFEEQGGVATSKGDWAWLQHTLASMKDNGRAAIVLDTGAVSRGSGSKNEDKERNIRKWFVENDYIEGVILMPENLFYNTNAPGVIIVLNRQKQKTKKGKVVLINASSEFKKGQPKNYLTPAGIEKIAKSFTNFSDGDGFSRIISIEEIAENDFNLAPSRFINTSQTVHHRSINDIAIDLRRLYRDAETHQKQVLGIIDQIVGRA